MPEGTVFATKPALAVEMIERAIAANMLFAWVAADAVYGVGDIEQALRRAGKGYVLGVKGDLRFGSWGDKPVVAGTAAQIASDLDPAAWQRLSAGNGTKGARLHDWAEAARFRRCAASLEDRRRAISNSRTLMLTNTPTVCPARGPGAC